MRRSSARARVEVERVIDGAMIDRIAETVRAVPIADHVMRYALRLVRATRVGEADAATPRIVSDYVSWGAGPRASENLVLGAKAKALLTGDTHVTPEHVRAVAHPVLRHRVLLNFNAEADQVSADAIVDGLLEAVPVEESDASTRRQMDAAFGSTA